MFVLFYGCVSTQYLNTFLDRSRCSVNGRAGYGCAEEAVLSVGLETPDLSEEVTTTYVEKAAQAVAGEGHRTTAFCRKLDVSGAARTEARGGGRSRTRWGLSLTLPSPAPSFPFLPVPFPPPVSPSF